MTDLISSLVGGRIVACNDEFFAEAENLLKTTDPVWEEVAYTDRGKWMDGWETRRRREPGHDWCLIALGIPGMIESVTVDTSHFTGNYPESFSLEACGVGSDDRLDEARWVEVIPRTALAGDAEATFEVDDAHRVTHLRFNIFPDGGVARLRVDGEPIPSRDHVCPEGGKIDLVSSVVGGVALDVSDLHYSPPSNLLRPTEPAGMWDGWETRRRRGPGHDWARFWLGLPGAVESIAIDTRYFKGNSPGWVSIHLSDDGETWQGVVDRAEVKPDSVNTVDLDRPAPAHFLRLDIHPDGGVARLRVLGTPDPEAVGRSRLAYVNALFEDEARAFLRTACAAHRWIEAMLQARPYPDVQIVMAESSAAFDSLGDDDWLEAFAGHARIGEKGDAAGNREQAGVADAPGSVLAELEEVNRVYEQAFGFTYIVKAAGKSAEEMLDIARVRLGSSREEEIIHASQQQRGITETRLRHMLCIGDHL